MRDGGGRGLCGPPCSRCESLGAMATEKKEGRATVKTCGFERIDVAENKLPNVAYERLRNFWAGLCNGWWIIIWRNPAQYTGTGP